MTFTRDAIIGLAVLIIIILGAVWYVFSRPATVTNIPPEASSTTPTPTAVGPQHVTDSGQFYTADEQYPGSTALAATAGASADATAVAAMKAFEESALADFKQSFTDLDPSYAQHLTEMNQKGSLTATYDTHQSANTVSYVYTIYEDTLGAHPNTTYKTFTFATSDGAALALGDLFTPGSDYLTFLSTYARAKLPAMIAARENVTTLDSDSTDMLNAGTTADAKNFSDFYLDGSNLVILFPPYAIGPYVLGSTELDIPLSQVKGLKPEYAQ